MRYITVFDMQKHFYVHLILFCYSYERELFILIIHLQLRLKMCQPHLRMTQIHAHWLKYIRYNPLS